MFIVYLNNVPFISIQTVSQIEQLKKLVKIS